MRKCRTVLLVIGLLEIGLRELVLQGVWLPGVGEVSQRDLQFLSRAHPAKLCAD